MFAGPPRYSHIIQAESGDVIKQSCGCNQVATHNQYFKEFATLTVSVDKALAYFAVHPDMVLGLFGLYCEESGLELKQAA